jgi:hypothetical protein
MTEADKSWQKVNCRDAVPSPSSLVTADAAVLSVGASLSQHVQERLPAFAPHSSASTCQALEHVMHVMRAQIIKIGSSDVSLTHVLPKVPTPSLSSHPQKQQTTMRLLILTRS